MKRGLYIAGILVVVLLLGFTSAGLLDSIRDALTGKATSQPTNVSVTIAGASQINVTVDNSTLTGGVVLTESSTTSSTIYLTICDPDGVGDLNDSSAQASFQKLGETTRTDSSCSLVGDLDTYCANYSCSVDNWYWDGAGEWIINASATDLGNLTRIYNDTFVFSIQELKALVISPDQLTWTGISPGATDEGADNDPTVVNNTGNYEGVINVTGLDLYGATTTTERFAVGNFSADESDGACGAGTFLVNSTTTAITGTDSSPGNLSAGAGKEDIYYCIDVVPLLSSQEYTTDISGSWTVSF